MPYEQQIVFENPSYESWVAEKGRWLTERDALLRENTELRRRIENALDLLDGREDASCEPGEERFRPNLEMQIGMALRGEDRP